MQLKIRHTVPIIVVLIFFLILNSCSSKDNDSDLESSANKNTDISESEIPILEPISDQLAAANRQSETEFNDAHGENPYPPINYEIAPDMYVNVEWVATMTVEECIQNNIDIDIIEYFMDRLTELKESDEHYNYLYEKLAALKEEIK